MILVSTSPLLHPVFDMLAWAGAGATGLALRRCGDPAPMARLAAVAGPGYFLSLAMGVVLGAWGAGSLNSLRQTVPTLSHSLVGALAGGVVAVEIYKAVRGVRGSTGGVFVAPTCVGMALGRWGCLFAGLPDRTFGSPTTLPWAVNLGDGVGRHPVQVYESLAMALFLALWLMGRRLGAGWAGRRGFYAMVVWYGGQRFCWEFLKPYPPVLGPFNLFHLICAGLIAYGCLWFVRDLAGERAERRGPLSVPGTNHQPV